MGRTRSSGLVRGDREEDAAWDEADEVADRAKRHAASSEASPPSRLYAMRLDGRACCRADGTTPPEPVNCCASAADGFSELEAILGGRVTGLDVAHVLATSGEAEPRRSVAAKVGFGLRGAAVGERLTLARGFLGDPT